MYSEHFTLNGPPLIRGHALRTYFYLSRMLGVNISSLLFLTEAKRIMMLINTINHETHKYFRQIHPKIFSPLTKTASSTSLRCYLKWLSSVFCFMGHYVHFHIMLTSLCNLSDCTDLGVVKLVERGVVCLQRWVTSNVSKWK